MTKLRADDCSSEIPSKPPRPPLAPKKAGRDKEPKIRVKPSNPVFDQFGNFASRFFKGRSLLLLEIGPESSLNMAHAGITTREHTNPAVSRSDMGGSHFFSPRSFKLPFRYRPPSPNAFWTESTWQIGSRLPGNREPWGNCPPRASERPPPTAPPREWGPQLSVSEQFCLEFATLPLRCHPVAGQGASAGGVGRVGPERK